MATTRNRLTLRQFKDRKVQQVAYFSSTGMEIVTRDTFGTEIRTRYNFGNNNEGFGSTRIITRGRSKVPTP